MREIYVTSTIFVQMQKDGILLSAIIYFYSTLKLTIYIEKMGNTFLFSIVSYLFLLHVLNLEDVIIT